MKNKIDVREAYEMRKKGASYEEIAQKYGVKTAGVRAIINVINRYLGVEEPKPDPLEGVVFPVIADYMRREGLTFAGLARRAHVKYKTLCPSLRGKNLPRIDTQTAIAKTVGRPVNECFRRVGEDDGTAS